MQGAKNAIFQTRFPQKLWYLLGLQTDVISWGSTGRTILLNYKTLQNYLQCGHSIFKTGNISSFIRQLNLYGFRKVTSHLQDPMCNSSNPYIHEFIHDYFIYGRPEFLNKIVRKTFTMKKRFKPKAYIDNPIYMSPLQKARRALHIALQKAAHDLAVKSRTTEINRKFEFYDAPDNYCVDEENVGPKWLITKNENNNNESSKELTRADITDNVKAENTENGKYGDLSQDSVMDFSEVACQQNNFPTQYLSMPTLDDEANDNTSGIELLAEFNIGEDIEEGVTKKTNEKLECNLLNCVLPSVSYEHIEDVSILEVFRFPMWRPLMAQMLAYLLSMLQKNNEDLNNCNSEWDQMFNDMISNKGSTQGVSNFQELYSQISQTIDLLNT